MSLGWMGLASLFLIALFGGTEAHTDRDIVYAARYYAPPGSHRTSHFHLYRISPDGTGRTQLTFGNNDDYGPKWSPDGRWIAFTRQTTSGKSALYLIRSTSSPIKQLTGAGFTSGAEDDYSAGWSPDGRLYGVVHTVFNKTALDSVSLIDPITKRVSHRLTGANGFLWSPDGKHAYIRYNKIDAILDLISGKQIAVQTPAQQRPAGLDNVVWSDNQTLVEIVNDPVDEPVHLSLFGLDGRETRRVLCRWGKSTQNPFTNSIDPWGRSLLPVPGIRHLLVYVQDEGNSGTRPDNVYYLADTQTGQMTKFTEGQFLAWVPYGTMFCTAEARHLADYGKPVNGYQKSLYVASLQIGRKKSGKMKNITPGLVWVTGADWRKPPKSASRRM